MADDKVSSIEELRRLQEAAQAQGSSITNYSQWAEILEDLDVAGVQSTGSFDGDKKLHEQIIEEIQAIVEENNNVQKQQEVQPKHDDLSKLDNKTQQDSEQTVKANVVNATSSMIMADYMKYYHLLH